MKISLIISTYNSPRALKASLETLRNQTLLPDEVLIADDGSREDTATLVKEFGESVCFPVIHIWQPDEGFQLAKIRNKAIAEASGDYIIQTDGDILLERHFIEDHASSAKKGYFLCGSRSLLDKKRTELWLEGKIRKIGPMTDGVFNRKNAVRSIPLSAIVRFLSPLSLKYRGCNMSFWKEDLVRVNGYDESFVGWGCEDHDLVARLINLGVKGLQLRHKGVCFHLWHPSSKENGSFEKNNRILEQTRTSRKIRATKGLDSLVPTTVKAEEIKRL